MAIPTVIEEPELKRGGQWVEETLAQFSFCIANATLGEKKLR